MGNEVYCVDVDEKKIQELNHMRLPIYEPGLENLVRTNCNNKRLCFSTDLRKAIEETDVVFIAVGTPAKKDGSADLSYVMAVAGDLGRYMTHHMYVVDKSTVPVGTAEKIRRKIQEQLEERDSDLTFDMISNPEFLKEGAAIGDCMRPDRIVIGADSDNALRIMKKLYMPFVRNTENFISMDICSAEMTKYAANAMLATKISFMNEMANICERVGADINKVRRGIGSDQRIGYQFIYPGCGYGGSCFPKDVKALISTGQENGYEARILQSVEAVNSDQKRKLVEMATKRFGENLEGRVFGVWGLSFKPDTDDMREAPSITIINELIKRGATIHAYDSKACKEAKHVYLKDQINLDYFEDKYEALQDVDAMFLVTEWKEFRCPDFDEMKNRMKQAIIFDGRNQYSQDELNENGFEYYQIGVKMY